MPTMAFSETFLAHSLRSKNHGLQTIKKGVLPMSIQGSLENLMKVFLTFYIGCCLIGRPDIPLKLVAQLRTPALAGTTARAGAARVFFITRLLARLTIPVDINKSEKMFMSYGVFGIGTTEV